MNMVIVIVVDTIIIFVTAGTSHHLCYSRNITLALLQQECHVSLIYFQAPELALAGAGAFTGEKFVMLKEPE